MSVKVKNEKSALTVVGKVNKSTEMFSAKMDAVLIAAGAGLKEITKLTTDASIDLQVLLENIDSTELKLTSLNEDYSKKSREADYDLNMKSKENSDKVLSNLLRAADLESFPEGMVHDLNITVKSLELQLKSAIDTADKEKANEIARAVGAAISRKELEFKATTAEGLAANQSLTAQLKVANTQITDLKDMIEAERNARVQEAQARSGSQVTVNAAK